MGEVTRREHAVRLAAAARLRMSAKSATGGARRLTHDEWVEVAEDVRRRLGLPLPSPLRRGECDIHGDECGCGFLGQAATP